MTVSAVFAAGAAIAMLALAGWLVYDAGWWEGYLDAKDERSGPSLPEDAFIFRGPTAGRMVTGELLEDSAMLPVVVRDIAESIGASPAEVADAVEQALSQRRISPTRGTLHAGDGYRPRTFDGKRWVERP